MQKVTAIILAGGGDEGTQAKHPHAMYKILDVPVITWVVLACREAGADKIIVAAGLEQDEVQRHLKDEVPFVLRENIAEDALQALEGDVLVLLGETPLVTAKTIRDVIGHHRKNENAVTVFSEERPSGDEPVQMYCFKADKFNAAPLKTNIGSSWPAHMAEFLRDKGERVGTYKIADENEMLFVNNKVQLYLANKIMQKRINLGHIKNGVTIWDIENTYIGPLVKIEPDAEILPGCILFGNTEIFEGSVIGPSSNITDSRIGKNVSVKYSVVDSSIVGDFTCVGPFAYIRPSSKIGKGCKVGDFVEIKNTVLGDGCSASHLTYLGDAVVGSKVNFGCGSITVNYDGNKKHTTNIGNNAFIGCNTNLVAPVTVGDNSYIAAGSTITDYVPEKSLAIARARQVIKNDWQDKRKKKD